MAGTSRAAAAARTTELQMPHHMRWKDGREETSPERTKIWTEPPNGNNRNKFPDRRVPVIYYISRNGQLEHPHFMEVHLSSPEGLYLKDVINRLNFLRGKGLASLYSWSSKRSYKNGYVWHDLSENDFIFPAHGQEYILKGSEILESAVTTSKSDETGSYSGSKLPAADTRGGDHEFPAVKKAHRRRNQSWSSFDLHEYKVYAGESVSRAAAADASTQTDDKRRRRRAIREIEEAEDETEEKGEGEGRSHCQSNASEIIVSSTDEISEISPPPSDSSPETLETLMKAGGRIILRPEAADEDRTANNNNSSHQSSGRMKASSVLMQLLSCGSMGFKDCGPGQGKENGFSLISHYKVRLPRGGRGNNNQVGKDASESEASSVTVGSSSGFGGGRRVKLEEKEYFSGSLVETKKNEFPALKRSSSYNADRSSQLEVGELEEINEGSRAKCIPRKPKTSGTRATKMERSTSDLSCSSKG